MDEQDRAAREVIGFNEATTANIELVEMTTKFSGAILRKAELENNFDKVYSRVFEKMVEFQFFGNSENVLEIFGESGG